MGFRSRIHPVADEALGNTAYLVDVGGGEALVVDPRRDIDVYLDAADRASLRIVGVLETHLHADFVSGAQELHATTEARIIASAEAGLAHEHRGVTASDLLSFGDVTVEVIATPGHTPEHISFLITGPDGAAVFSGGSLINGGAARTDLTGAERTEHLAREQFASIHRIAALPDETLLCPTHGPGSFCSAAEPVSTFRTIGEERATHPLLVIDDEERFVPAFRATFGSYPPYFQHLREINRVGPEFLARLDEPSRLDGPALAAAIQDAWVIDARSVGSWAKEHPVGAISIELRPAFASWLGWVVPFGEPFVVVLDGPGDLPQTLRLARRIGYDDVRGWTTLDDWRAAGLATASVENVAPSHGIAEGAVLLDVRQDSEFAGSHLPNAVHIELGDIIAGVVPPAADVVVYCGHGERSATAASILAGKGVRARNLAGGMGAWRRGGLPVAR